MKKHTGPMLTATDIEQRHKDAAERMFDDGLPDQDTINRMYALYKAEKAAGLHMTPEELAEQLRDAGRGHLVKP